MAKKVVATDSPTPYSAPALEKGFNVIELLSASPNGLTLTEIAAGLRLRSMSEIFRIIRVMEQRQWLRKDPDTDLYTLTHRALETVLNAIPTHDLIEVAVPAMAELSQRIEQSCHIVALNDYRGLVLTRQESPGPTGFAVRRGAEIDPVRTCSGHVLMAFSSPVIVKRVLSQHPPLTEAETARIDTVSAQGFEVMPSIRTRGVTDLSCPIIGFDGYAVAALTVPFLELIDGTQNINVEQALSILKEQATRISDVLGQPNAGA